MKSPETVEETTQEILSDLGQPPHDGNGGKVGLLPQKGWMKRNYNFLSQRILPTIWTPRETALSELAPVYSDLDHNEIEVIWIGHATFLVRTPHHNILIDPNWALWHGPVKRARAPGLLLDHLPEIDIVLISHAHFDHMHKPSIRRVANGKQIAIVPRGVGRSLRRMNFKEIREMETWDVWKDEEVEIVFTPAHHWGARFIHDTWRGFGSFLIRTKHSSLYHGGDSAYFGGFSEIARRYDIGTTLLPIGAYGAPSGRNVHMNPEEALQAFEDLQGTRMIPMHHATFPLGTESLCEPLRRLNLEAESRNLLEHIHTPREGELLRLGH